MKKKTPPFEVMRSRITQPIRSYAPSPAGGASANPGPRLRPTDEADDASIDEGWLAQAQQPLLLRLPRGLVAAFVGVLLLLVVLAYGVGHARGVRSGEETVRTQMGELSEGVALLPEDAGMRPTNPPTQSVGVGVGTGGRTANASPTRGHETAQFVAAPTIDTAVGANQGASIRRASSDPREPGLNYFVLAHYPIEDAARLKKFLEQQGIPCVILSTSSANQYQIQALNGFMREELNSAEFKAFREKIIRLGFIWKSEHRGPTDLSGCYPQLYKAAE